MDVLRLISVLAVGVVSVGLAMAVYLRNPKNKTNRAFAAAVVAIVLWLALAFLSDQDALHHLALPLNRLTFAASMAMGSLLLYFALQFPTAVERVRSGWHALFAATALMGTTTALTPLMVADVEHADYGTNVIPGPLFYLMAFWIVMGIACIVVVLARKYPKSEGRSKVQLKFMLLGLAAFTVTSVVLGLILPVLTGSYQLSTLNTFSALFLIGPTAYAMVKHRFMDIRRVVLRGVVYVILIVGVGALFAATAVFARMGLIASFGINAEVAFFVTSFLAALAFQPARYSLEKATDRFFYRRTYDPQRLLTSLGRSMASKADARDRADLLAHNLREGMRLVCAAVVYWQAEKLQVVSAGEWPIDPEKLSATCCAGECIVFADDPETNPELVSLLLEHHVRVMVPLAVDGVELGVIVLGDKLSGEMYSSTDAGFLEILGTEASLAMKNGLLFDERDQRVRELTALNTLSSALGRDMQLDSVLDRALHQVMSVTDAEAGSIMLLEPEDGTLTIKASEGLPSSVVRTTCVRLGEGIAGWVAKHRKALVLMDAVDSGFEQDLRRDGIKSALCVPLVRSARVIGVLNVSRCESAEAFSRENLKVVAAFAGQLAVAIENAQLYADLENTFLGTIAALAAAVDAKDPYTYGHSSDVTAHALSIAEELGLDETTRERLRIAALLHDIGKIGIDGAILNKPGRLTDEEYERIKCHPDIAAGILDSLDFLHDVVPLVHYHHERYDGQGYPTGIAGEEIPLGARIISVADAYNAMVSDRTYRKALTPEKAMRELKDNAGTQFDPAVVEAFLRSHNRVKPMPSVLVRNELPADELGQREEAV